MKLRLALLAFFAATSFSADAVAQSSPELVAAAFTKHKNVTKTRHGVTKSKYKEIRTEPAVRTNPESYSGEYEVSDWGFDLTLTVDRSGNVSGYGKDPLPDHPEARREFTLRNARIDGATITARKVFADGRTERFEGAFLHRTDFESPTDKGVSTFGLGVIGQHFISFGLTIDKLFYEKVR